MTARCCRQPVFRLTKPVPHRLQGPAFGLCRPGQSALIILRCQSSLAAVNLTVTLLPPAKGLCTHPACTLLHTGR